FFSSRRRHTRFSRDWSSDVCSSDLGVEVDIFQMFHSSQTVEGGDNFIHYRNPELDRLIDAARAEVSEEARMALWQAAERILATRSEERREGKEADQRRWA